MYLNDLLTERNISKYRLAKISGVPNTTVVDICSGKSQIEKCSAETVYRIATALNVSMESLIESQVSKHSNGFVRSTFNVYKSNVCHLLKSKGDIDFIIDTLETDEIRTLYNRRWYAEAFYLLAMIDYLSRLNDIPICSDYNDIRTCKLEEPIYPSGIMLLDYAANTDRHRKAAMAKAIPEFLKYNIVESEIRDVC